MKLIYKIKKNKVVRVLFEFLSLMSKNGISAYSVQGAYYVFASTVPFLILILTILKYTPLDMNFASQKIVETLPAYFQSFGKDIVEQIYTNSNLAMSFSIITLIWTASKGIYVIVDGLNIINNTEKHTSYIKDLIFSILYTLIFAFAVPVLIVVAVFGQSIMDLLMKYIPILNKFQTTLVLSKFIGSTMIIFLLLILIYKFMPNKKMKLKDIILGTLVSTMIWQLFTYAFSLYVDISLKNASLYGGMNIILIFLFWLYCTYYIIFVGAQINAMAYNKRTTGKYDGVIHQNINEINLIQNSK